MRGATTVTACYYDIFGISIHAPHARSDPSIACRVSRRTFYFNPRSSCEERPGLRVTALSVMTDFNPRSSCEERQHTMRQLLINARDFNPRSSCEERPGLELDKRHLHAISIHAPHARSDKAELFWNGRKADFNPRSSCEERLYRLSMSWTNALFQSTLLMRGATAVPVAPRHDRLFQSTLLMRGATWPRTCAKRTRRDFNPRSSCEERRFQI